jgi:hypothetical protein
MLLSLTLCARQVAVGGAHVLLVTSGGTLFAMGVGVHGRLGLGECDVQMCVCLCEAIVCAFPTQATRGVTARRSAWRRWHLRVWCVEGWMGGGGAGAGDVEVYVCVNTLQFVCTRNAPLRRPVW